MCDGHVYTVTHSALGEKWKTKHKDRPYIKRNFPYMGDRREDHVAGLWWQHVKHVLKFAPEKDDSMKPLHEVCVAHPPCLLTSFKTRTRQ